ncbi:MAG: four helix bundle suffix domain-containing protein [Bacteroidaceae bacterium]|nr:four helix bundle suffix domain-containing protein [Bacteroidaceae bacterium]
MNIIPNRGSKKIEELICYQKSMIIYDLTYLFAERYLKRGDRTIDQMVQAARSAKQNIVEGYTAGATSVETELKLFNVAKASALELLADYEDYLRVRGLRQWEQGSKELAAAQRIGREHCDVAYWMELAATRGDETIANLAIVLIKQNDYLLYKYLQTIAERFTQEGGFREKLTRVRKERRGY